MAEEEKGDGEDEKPTAKGGNKKRLLLLVAIIGLVLGGSGLGAVTLLAGKSTPPAAAEAVKEPEGHGAPAGHGAPKADAHGAPKADAHGAPKGHGEAEAGKGNAAAEKIRSSHGKYFELKPAVVVNLRGTYGTRLIRTEIHLEYQDERVEAELREQNVRLRDFIIGQLCDVKLEEIDSLAGRNKLRRELREGLNKILQSGQVLELYFAEFLIK